MIPLSQRLKDAALSLAESTQSEEGARLLGQIRRLLQVAGERPRAAPAAAPCHIGIWEPQKCGNEYRFVRPTEPREQASLWANVATLEPKGRRKRVVLIGESVARGFFFDPHFNSAMVLQNTLREASGDREVEVVDLARTDLTMDQLLELAGSAVQLAPDAVVVLAGNNWQPTIGLSPLHFLDLSDRLRNGGWGDVKTHLEELLREQVRATLQGLCRFAHIHRFKLIFALPEFNLVDWRTDSFNPPLLDCAATAEWHALRAAAEAALAAGDATRVEALGLQLVALDKGTTAVGFNLVANAMLRAGAVSKARKYLEAARDSAICWPNGPESPRCFTAIQDVVRCEATKNQFLLVDLPRTFQDHLRGGLPDHRLFLDYCHFNVAATHLAMAAVAQAVLTSLYKVRQSLGALNTIKVAVDPLIEGEAYFLAAIHNANWGQRAELVRQYCDKALELAPTLQRMLGLFLDFHIRRIPSSLCKSFDELCHLPSASAISLLFDSVRPTAAKFLNPMLMEAVAGALDALHPHAPSTQAAMEMLLRAEHGVDDRIIDLLNKAYSSDSYLTPLNPSNHAFYRANSGVSRFQMICKQPRAVRLDLTYRTRRCVTNQHVTVRVHNTDIGQLPVSSTWTTANILVPVEVLRSGINTVEIQWPAPEWDVATWKIQVAEGLQNARAVDVSPVYGEIHAFQAAVVATLERNAQDSLSNVDPTNRSLT